MEALVVIAIIGILGSIAMFAWRQMIPRIRLQNSAREVTTFLQRARLTAIRMSQPVEVSLATSDKYGESTDWNPDSISQEWLVLEVVSAFGEREELASHQIIKSYPTVYLWGDQENVIHGPSSNTFPDQKVIFNSDGTVRSTGALRFSYLGNDISKRNVLEVAFLTQAGSPAIRKYLVDGDRPTGTSQEYFEETISTTTQKNLWVWY